MALRNAPIAMVTRRLCRRNSTRRKSFSFAANCRQHCANGRRKKNSRSPWFWIPTLYFAEGLPNALAMSVSVVLYKNLGVSNAAIGVLHQLALFAVGHQAAVESGRGHFENAAAMDLGDAIVSRRDARGRGADDSRAAFFPIDACVFLAAGIQFGHARHRGGRFLHAGDDGARAIVFHRHPQHVLSASATFSRKAALVIFAGELEKRTGNFVLGLVNRLCARSRESIFALGIYHRFILPRPAIDHRRKSRHEKFLREFLETFGDFFQKPKIILLAVFHSALSAGRGAIGENASPFFCDARSATADWA